MATFQQIIVNFIAGIFVFAGSVGLFGAAVRFEFNKHLAPRTWSRPRAVLKNVLKGAYACRWYSWALSLSYPDLLDGIPGTGTRNNGWSGPLLKTNLDGVIMLKFHTLLMKVSFLAAILCMFITFPVNFTAECDPDILGWGTCVPILNQTNFEKSTIAHLPPFEFNPVNTSHEDYTAFHTGVLEATVAPGVPNSAFVRVPTLTIRYFAIVLVATIIYIYACVLVRREWIDNIALRRIYYLEHDHYEERLEELEFIEELQDPEDPFQERRPPWLPHPEIRETVPNISLYSALYKLPTRLVTTGLQAGASDLERQLHATVEFFDECVPNQPGYSSSVAAVTILPEAKFVKVAWAKWYHCAKRVRKLRYIRSILKAKLEQQRAEEEVFVEEKEGTGERGDSGTPPTAAGLKTRGVVPGEESLSDKPKEESPLDSIVEAQEETKGEDNETPTKASQLSSVDEAASTQLESVAEVPPKSENDTATTEISLLLSQTKEASNETAIESEDGIDGEEEDGEVDQFPEPSTAVSFGGTITTEYETMEKAEPESNVATAENDKDAGVDVIDVHIKSYSDFDPDKYARATGVIQCSYDEAIDLEGVGIEQLSVWAREFSQNSSNACPFGLAHNVIKFASVDYLERKEVVAIQLLKEAQEELKEARAMVMEKVSGTVPDADSDSDDDEDHGNPANDIELAMPSVKEENPASLRKRKTNSSKWRAAERMAHQIRLRPGDQSMKNSMRTAASKRTKVVERKLKESTKKIVSFLDHPTYAVVTFTSRQAAIAARQCLTDGGGLDRWTKIDELPISPLADAPPRSILHCRGFCRPVTLTISDNEKYLRTWTANTFWFLFSLSYTIPLALTSQLLNPTQLAEWFPDVEAFSDPDSFFFKFLSGISSGLIYTLFFSFCPQLFKAMANFKGNASSMAVAEDNALQYYWIFMLLTAFTGSAFANMLFQLFSGAGAGEAIKDVLRDVALAIPTQQAPVWLNWIVIRFTYTLPFLYLFQANTFGFAIIRWPWMNRVMRGGGPGGPPPYRIYIDGGTVFLCTVALGPVCPTITPFAFLYFCVMNPMLRWMLIFVYRPKYDGGGNKWPILHEVIISAVICSQVLFAIMLFLKYAYGASIMMILYPIPTYLFGERMKTNFQRQFKDAGLLQTSRLDGWDTERATSATKREEYRRWLVDCHKASYVPVCLASSDSLLTAEPCAVVKTNRDDVEENDKHGVLTKQGGQRMALFRREKSNKDFQLSPIGKGNVEASF